MLFDGDLAQVGTNENGMAVVASERLGIAYEVTVTDVDNNVVPGAEVFYQETEDGRSVMVIQDPLERFGPLVVVGSPEYISGLEALQPASVLFGADVGDGVVEPRLVGVGTFLVLVVGATLTALVAKKHTDSLFQNAVEATVFFEGGVIVENSLEMCRTPAEIARFWQNQASMEEALEGIEFSLITLPVQLVPGTEKITIAIDLASLTQPEKTSVDLGEELVQALIIETGADLTMDSTLHVRIADLDTYGTREAVLRAPLEVVAFDCDPTDFVSGTSLDVTHDPPYPAAFQGVNVTGTLVPAEAGVLVEFDARGTDEYRQFESALTNESGSVTFYVPGGAAGVRDEYVMFVPTLQISAYDSLVFGASPSASGLPGAQRSTKRDGEPSGSVGVR